LRIELPFRIIRVYLSPLESILNPDNPLTSKPFALSLSKGRSSYIPLLMKNILQLQRIMPLL